MSDNSTSTNDSLQCGDTNNVDTFFHVRIAAVFVILVTSMCGALFPVLARRAWTIPVPAYDFAKYFGSGVIIATAFIHLLAPAFDELGSPCLGGAWTQYDWAPAFAMASVFVLFFVELTAFRWGTARMKKAGGTYVSHAHSHNVDHNKGPHEASDSDQQEYKDSPEGSEKKMSDVEKAVLDVEEAEEKSNALAHIVAVAILEFGVMFHSVIIGLTLAVDPDFKTLFIVIIFHQMFEGLGLGTRLALLQLPQKYNYVPYAGAILYSITTPIGIAAGLGIRTTYNPGSTTASIVSGILDSISAGILIYTGLVELLAHEFLFNPVMRSASNGRIAYAGICILLGAGIMALLGRWA